MSDFTLLQETGRAVDASNRTLNSVLNGTAISGGMMHRLKQEAAKRDIRLSFMPQGLSRHNRNTSEVKKASMSRVIAAGLKGAQMLFWHVDVYFAGARSGDYRLVKMESTSEEISIQTIMANALRQLLFNGKRRRTNIPSLEKHTPALYEDKETSDLAVFLQNEHVNAIAPVTAQTAFDMQRYVRLDHEVSLFQSLRGRAIVEYPVLYVAMKGSPAEKRLSKATLGLFETPEPGSDSEDSNHSWDEEDQKRLFEETAHDDLHQEEHVQNSALEKTNLTSPNGPSGVRSSVKPLQEQALKTEAFAPAPMSAKPANVTLPGSSNVKPDIAMSPPATEVQPFAPIIAPVLLQSATNIPIPAANSELLPSNISLHVLSTATPQSSVSVAGVLPPMPSMGASAFAAQDVPPVSTPDAVPHFPEPKAGSQASVTRSQKERSATSIPVSHVPNSNAEPQASLTRLQKERSTMSIPPSLVPESKAEPQASVTRSQKERSAMSIPASMPNQSIAASQARAVTPSDDAAGVKKSSRRKTPGGRRSRFAPLESIAKVAKPNAAVQNE